MIPESISSFDDLKDSVLDALRQEPKKRTSSTREKEKLGHTQRQYEVLSADGARNYSVFTRRSTSNPGVFSVGLTLVFPDRQLILCRYNSGHHGHRNILEKSRIPAVAHRHFATSRYMLAGLDPDGYAEPCPGYVTMEEALAKLVHDCRVEGILKTPPQGDSSGPIQTTFL